MLVFDNKSTEAIKMNHLKTLICGGFVGVETGWKPALQGFFC
jgi:hypothetical protein